jgi:aspartyl-tRNA(Asn)/glutamyl-tRNA(Gln) amidotransferase subunit C
MAFTKPPPSRWRVGSAPIVRPTTPRRSWTTGGVTPSSLRKLVLVLMLDTPALRAGNRTISFSFEAQAANSLRLLFAKLAACWQESRLPMPAAHQIDIHHVAKLARLTLTEDEAARYAAQLDGILTYIDTLTQHDLGAAEPTAHAMPVYDVLRADVSAPGLHAGAGAVQCPQALGRPDSNPQSDRVIRLSHCPPFHACLLHDHHAPPAARRW